MGSQTINSIIKIAIGTGILALAVAGHVHWSFEPLVSIVLGIVGLTVLCNSVD